MLETVQRKLLQYLLEEACYMVHLDFHNYDKKKQLKQTDSTFNRLRFSKFLVHRLSYLVDYQLLALRTVVSRPELNY
jgi:hypothetical protein